MCELVRVAHQMEFLELVLVVDKDDDPEVQMDDVAAVETP